MSARILTLRDYQVAEVAHMLQHERCNLWARMGTGKTLASLVVADFLRYVWGDGDPILVMAPKRVARDTWPDEVQKWPELRHLDIAAAVGDPATRLAALRSAPDIVTCNYEQAPWLVQHYGKKWPFRTVFADESSKLKGFRLRQGTQRSQALGRIAHKLTRRWVNLTGTPAANGLIDLWGPQWFVDRGDRLGLTFDAFKRRWFVPERVGADAFAVRLVPLPHARTEIEERLADVTLTVDFPGRELPIENTIYVDLPASCRARYRELEREFFTKLATGQEVEAMNAAMVSMKCLQMANGAVFHEKGQWAPVHDAKLEALDSIVEEAAGNPMLVVYQFVPDRDRILKAFPQARLLGDDPQVQRDWNAGKVPMLVLHAASAGHGLNLQDGGHTIVFFNLWWNLEEHEQVIERIGPVRQKQSGYDRAVYVHRIVTRGTIDELVLQRLTTKASVQQVLLDAMRERRR